MTATNLAFAFIGTAIGSLVTLIALSFCAAAKRGDELPGATDLTELENDNREES